MLFASVIRFGNAYGRLANKFAAARAQSRPPPTVPEWLGVFAANSFAYPNFMTIMPSSTLLPDALASMRPARRSRIASAPPNEFGG